MALAASPSRAESPSEGATDLADRREVTVTTAGDAEGAEAIEAVLRERIGGELRVTFARTPKVERGDVLASRRATVASDGELGRVFVDLGDPERVTLYIVDARSDRVLVRELERTANPEVAWEETGHIVELAVGALRRGQLIGTARSELVGERPPPPPPLAAPMIDSPAPEPARPAVVAPKPRVHGGLFWNTSAYGSGPEVATGPGAFAELKKEEPRVWSRAPLHWGGLLSGELRFPSNAAIGGANVRTRGGAVHLLATGGVRLGRAHELTLGLGGGVDFTRAEVTGAVATNARLTDSEIVPTATLRGLARYAWRTPVLGVFAGIGLDVSLENTRYVAVRDGAPFVLFEPWGVRPFALVGLSSP